MNNVNLDMCWLKSHFFEGVRIWITCARTRIFIRVLCQLKSYSFIGACKACDFEKKYVHGSCSCVLWFEEKKKNKSDTMRRELDFQ